MKLLAPSYGRAGSVCTHKLLPGVVYAVHEFEAAEYRAQGHKVVVIPDSERGNIAKVRNWLKRYGEAKHKQGFVILDDDIEEFRYWQNCREVKLTGDLLVEHIESMFVLARQWGVSLFGVNPAYDKGSYREFTPFSTTSYVSGSFNGFLKCPFYFDERIPLKEDYDLCIQVCNGERKVLRFNQYALYKDDHGNRGGCAGYRTIEREQEQFELLQRKWGPDIVRRDGGASRVHRKKKAGYDLNPIIKIPIGGV